MTDTDKDAAWQAALAAFDKSAARLEAAEKRNPQMVRVIRSVVATARRASAR